jgi:hypothetical protein
LATGAIVGLLGDIFISRIVLYIKDRNEDNKEKGTAKEKQIIQVLIIVECNEKQAPMVKEVLWDNRALGVGTLPG